MKPTDKTLLEQLRITDLELEVRKRLFGFGDEDARCLRQARPIVEDAIDDLVGRFYESQTSFTEIALLIGDADTLSRLRIAQKKYVMGLFSGIYNLDYINTRLRIGLVHKRIGVEPKLYLAAVFTLKTLLEDLLARTIENAQQREATLSAIKKLFMFDVALVFETYIRSLVAEIETSKDKSEEYAHSLEEKVRERTRQLEEVSKTDPLTGLLNVGQLEEVLTGMLHSARKRSEPITLCYIDVNDFKKINDTLGHHRGDAVLRSVAAAIVRVARAEDRCFRYGGDEFCVILWNTTEAQAYESFERRLTAEISRLREPVSVSVGFCESLPPDYDSPLELVRNADGRMYQAKRTGRAAIPSAELESPDLGESTHMADEPMSLASVL
jgi:diguanylate cyclase (GGDEF)-like protein